MVGRLIQKKNIRITKKCLCKKDFDLLCTGQLAHHIVVKFCLDSKSVQKRCGIRFCFPSVQGCKFCFELARFDTVLICEVFFCVQRLFLFHDLIETGISHDNGVEYRIAVVFEVVLLQERKTLTWCEDDFSAGRFKLPGKDLKKCRFSGSVRSDQTVAVAFCKFDIYIFKQGFLPYAEGDITCTNHKKSPYSNRIIVSIFALRSLW